jgi:hypothetical protein
MYAAHAAARAGISVRTLRDWVNRGQADGAKDPYRSFALDYDKCRAIAVARNVGLIQKAADDDWRAAAWWLERAHPQDFGVAQRIQLSGDPDAPIEVQARATVAVTNIADAERTAQVLAALVEAAVLPPEVASVVTAEEG